MARIIYSGLVTQIRGSVGGTTFQQNRYGFTVKNKPNANNPNTARQLTRKAGLQAVVSQWSQLTQASRDLWNSWAATYPQQSSKNPDAYLSGFNLYLRWALNAQIDPANIPIFDPLDPPESVGSIDITVDLGVGNVLTVDAVFGAVPTEYKMLIYMSRQVKQSQQFVGSWTRYIQTVTFDDQPGPVDVTAAYTNIFGYTPDAGSYVAVELTIMQPATGYVVYSVPAIYQVQ